MGEVILSDTAGAVEVSNDASLLKLDSDKIYRAMGLSVQSYDDLIKLIRKFHTISDTLSSEQDEDADDMNILVLNVTNYLKGILSLAADIKTRAIDRAVSMEDTLTKARVQANRNRIELQIKKLRIHRLYEIKKSEILAAIHNGDKEVLSAAERDMLSLKEQAHALGLILY